jgi:phytanoyl-CoA hydroxylase
MPLTDAQIQQFEDEGFLALPDLLPLEASAPLRQELADIVEFEARQALAAGTIPETFPEYPFEKRLVKLCGVAADPEEMKEAVTGGKRLKTEAVFKLWTHPILVDVIEQLIGPEILAHPQFAVRSKMAFQAALPEIADDLFHQDSGFLLEESEGTRMVNCWMPLVDVNQDMGAIQFVRGSHKWGTLRRGNTPLVGREHYSPEDVASCPIGLGGALLYHKETAHRSVTNTTDKARWSIDIRFSDLTAPSGRPVRGFVARSRANPDTVAKHYYDDWARFFDNEETSAPHRPRPPVKL